jgi:hypothetical protein
VSDVTWSKRCHGCQRNYTAPRGSQRILCDRCTGKTWLSIAKFEDWQPGVPNGMVRVVATIDASRARSARRRSFLVPAAEYNAGAKPFKIDTTKHQEEL